MAALETRLEPAAGRDAAWDHFVAGQPDGHHEQTSAFGEQRASAGFEVLRLKVLEDGRILGGAQVLVQHTPLGQFAQLLRGPLARDGHVGLLDEVIAGLGRAGAARCLFSLRVDLFAEQRAARERLIAAGFTESQAWDGAHVSSSVHVEDSDDTILGRMSAKGRYNIRLAHRRGVSVRRGGAEDIDAFHALYSETARHQQFLTFPRAYFRALAEAFGDGGRWVLFIAELDGRPVAAIATIVIGDCMYYTFGGMHRGESVRRAMPNYALHFEAMRHARSMGCRRYDLVGQSQFKARLQHELHPWPLALRGLFGPARGLRGRLIERLGEPGIARQLLDRASRRLGYRRPLAW